MPYLPIKALVFIALCVGSVSAEESKLILSISEEGTEQQLPCRIRVYRAGQSGSPVYLGVCDGLIQIPLAAGEYRVRVQKGLEYERQEHTVNIEEGSEHGLNIQLGRLIDLPSRGWWSGDTHVHKINRSTGDETTWPLHMLAEDLHVAPVITVHNSLLSMNKLPEPAVIEVAPGYLKSLNNAEDEPFDDSVIYCRLKTLRPPETEVHGIVGRLIEIKRQQKKAWASIDAVNFESVPQLVATGEIDSIEVVSHTFSWNINQDFTMVDYLGGWGRKPRVKTWRARGLFHQELYYRYLNCGFRIPPSAGTAALGFVHPIGLGCNRVYVNIDEKFTYDSWWKHFKEGRVFVSNGPILLVTANDKLPGEVFQNPEGRPFTASIQGTYVSNDPLESIEIIKNGDVVEHIEQEGLKGSFTSKPLTFDKSGWFLVRAFTKVSKTCVFASTGPFYVEVGKKKATIHRKDAEYFIDWINSGKGEDKAGNSEAIRVYKQLLKEAE